MWKVLALNNLIDIIKGIETTVKEQSYETGFKSFLP